MLFYRIRFLYINSKMTTVNMNKFSSAITKSLLNFADLPHCPSRSLPSVSISSLQNILINIWSIRMKLNRILLGSVIASSALLMSTAHANDTRVAVSSALGGAVGAAIGQQMGGQTGAMIGSAIGGAGGAAASANKRDRNGAMIGAALGGAGGYSVGRNMAGNNGGYVGAGLGSAGGAVLGQKVSEDRRDDRYDRRYDSRGYRYNDYRYNDRYRKDNGLHLGHYKNGKRR